MATPSAAQNNTNSFQNFWYYVNLTATSSDGIEKLSKALVPACAVINMCYGFAIDIIRKVGCELKDVSERIAPLDNFAKEIGHFIKAIAFMNIFGRAYEWCAKDDEGRYQWESWNAIKIASRACLTVAHFCEHLLSWEIFGVSFGFLTAQVSSGALTFTPLRIVKDTFVIGASSFSIWNAAEDMTSGAQAKIDKADKKANKWSARLSDSGEVAQGYLDGLRKKYDVAKCPALHLGQVQGRDGKALEGLDRLRYETFAQALNYDSMGSPDVTLADSDNDIDPAVHKLFSDAAATVLNGRQESELSAKELKHFQRFTWAAQHWSEEGFVERISKKNEAWETNAAQHTNRKPMIEKKSKITIAYEVGKIALCALGITATLLLFASAWQFVGVMSVLALATGSLGFWKYIQDKQNEWYFENHNAFTLQNTFVTRALLA